MTHSPSHESTERGSEHGREHGATNSEATKAAGPREREELQVPASAGTANDAARPKKRFGQKKVSSLFGENHVLTRCFVVFGLTVLLLLPLGYFSNLVDERAWQYEEAILNIAERWGTAQTITGPALVIPYLSRDYYEYGDSKKGSMGTRHLVIFPKHVAFEANLSSQTRYKGIYRYVVYTTPVSISGSYLLPDDGPIADNRNLFLWDQAFFSVGVSDLKAIANMGELNWGDTGSAAFSPGAETVDLLGPGFYAKAPVRKDKKQYDFSMQIDLNGSGGIFFTPVGERTDIRIKGDWPAPNFNGTVLATKREVSPEGFAAEWNIPHISRDYPQSGTLESYLDRERVSVRSFTAGVSLHESVPLYRQITRSVKYGVLFIGLTFAALLGFELLSRSRLHLVQYGLVGVAMCLFYLVLLSLAEHIAFWQAFALASSVCVVMNGLYIAAAFRSKGRGLLIALLLTVLYSVLYALLQTEEYAILLGTALVVTVVCILMYLTRNLNRSDSAAAESGKDSVMDAESGAASQPGEGRNDDGQTGKDQADGQGADELPEKDAQTKEQDAMHGASAMNLGPEPETEK